QIHSLNEGIGLHLASSLSHWTVIGACGLGGTKYDSIMLRRLALHDPFRAGETDLQIQVRGRSPALLRSVQKRKIGGRLLRRPKQDYPTPTVAGFCTASSDMRASGSGCSGN